METPLRQLQSATSRALDIVSACVAHAYDTPVVSISGKAEGRARQPDGILLQEIDIHINWLETAIIEFGNTSTAALEKASVLHPPQHRDEDVDFMPREEVFLISSFVMNFRHGATHTLGMLKHSRGLVEERIARKGRKSLHFPKIKLNKWLFASTEERDAIIVPDRETFEREPDNKSNEEFINGKSTKRRKHRRSNFTGSTFSHKWRKFRRGLGRLLDWMANSNPFLYAIKFSIGVMLLSFPAFVTSWSGWYSENRGGLFPSTAFLRFGG